MQSRGVGAFPQPLQTANWLGTEKQGIRATEGDTGTYLESPEIINLLAEIEVELSDQQPILITREARGPAAVGSCHIARTIEVAEVVVSFKGQREVAVRLNTGWALKKGRQAHGRILGGKAFITTPRSANFQSPSLGHKGPRWGGRALFSCQSLSPTLRVCLDGMR